MKEVISLATLPWHPDEQFAQTFPYLDEELKRAMHDLATAMADIMEMAKNPLVIAVQIQGQRICTSFLAAVRCLEEGLICESASLGINAMESSWYVELFTLKNHIASRWLEGTEYPIKEVRKKCTNSEDKKEIYERLMQFTHSNYFSVPQKRLYRKSRDTEELALEQVLGVLLIQEIVRNTDLFKKFYQEFLGKKISLEER